MARIRVRAARSWTSARAAEDEVFRLALETVLREHRVRDAIRPGLPTLEAFERFGIM